ncbi:gas vesicle protein [Streptomyces sp. WMMB 322]|uniref:gas vesicle protein GvpO n=1 Tax=Streptomyces sp. WMMB 322 TaxID=1286821 RepID=UPI000823D25F|nr:gas vesicle protein [Streptomyces sp. WMMB 322]SCK52263.1 Gas vesicle synthesis protein GvpO [Streptomyces sp. WMMB 322]
MATTGDKESKDNKAQQTGQQRPSRAPENADRKQDRSSGADRNQGRSGSSQSGRVPIAEAMRLAAGQLAELLQCEPASVSSVKATDQGWKADVEVVEVERVPETTSVMGTYHVELDGQGNLLGYERTRRYARGQIDQRK